MWALKIHQTDCSHNWNGIIMFDHSGASKQASIGPRRPYSIVLEGYFGGGICDVIESAGFSGTGSGQANVK